MIKAILFDLDGTLINSIEDLANSTNFALREFGFPVHPVDKFKIFIGDGMFKLIERALPENKRTKEITEAVLERFMQHYRQHFLDKTTVYDGIIPLLKELKELGLKLAVISNKAHEMTLILIERLFPSTFDAVCGKQEGYPAKPNPALTLKTIEELKVKPDECFFIGDSGMDAATAVNAGCECIGVLWGLRGESELIENGANYIAKTPQDILNIIKGITYEI